MMTLLTTLALLAPLDIAKLWKNAVPFEKPLLLDDLVKLNKANGWKADSMPWTPRPQTARFKKAGNLDPAVLGSDVSLVYKWAVIDKVLIESSTKKQIRFSSIGSPRMKCEMDLNIGKETLKGYYLDLSRRTDPLNVNGGGVRFIAETGANEMRLEVYLQRVIQVYSQGKSPRLLSWGYESGFATATLIKRGSP